MSTESDNLAVFCREVRNLLRSKPYCMIPFSKFVPAYHNHYGRQCCVYQFGFTKLIELLESIPHVVQIIGGECGPVLATNTASSTGQSMSLLDHHNNHINIRQGNTININREQYFDSSSASSVCGGTNSLSSTTSSSSDSSSSSSSSLSRTNRNGGNTNQRYITLTHREQIKRFASDLIKVVKSQPGKRLKLSQFAQAYEQVLGRTFRVLDYGTNNINVLLAEIWEGTINIIPIKRSEHVHRDKVLDSSQLAAKPFEPLFVNVPLRCDKSSPLIAVLEQLVASHPLVNKPYITRQYPDCWFEIPKRERSEREIKRTKYFIWDVIELLSKMEPNHSVAFSKFIPAYHYYFNRQCKVSIFGFSKLIDLFESISPDVVEVLDQGPGEEKLIQLARKHWPAPLISSTTATAKKTTVEARNAPPTKSPSARRSISSINNNNNNSQVNTKSSNQRYNYSGQTRTNKNIDHQHHHHHHQEQMSAGSSSNQQTPTESSRTSSSCSAQHGAAIDCGPTEEELMELEHNLEAYEQLEAIKSKRSRRMAAILDIFKYPIC